jgi:hypothetical protein
MKTGGAIVPLQEALVRTLSDCRDQFLQRILSAGAGPEDVETLMGNAVEELLRTESPSVRLPDFEKRLLRAVDRQCQVRADLRRLPYRTIAPVICRHWSVLMEHSRKAGLGREEAFRVICDLIWKHHASWAAAENPEERLLADVTYGFHVIGLTRKGFHLVGGNSQ